MTDYPLYDYSPFNIPKDHLEAIGLITVTAAQTEYIVQSAICGCLEVDTLKGLATTTHMTHRLRDGCLRALAAFVIDDADDLDELDDILNRVQAAFDKRNAYVHNSWHTEPNTENVYFQKTQARGWLESKTKPVDSADIKADAIEIYNSGMKLFEFFHRCGLLPDPPTDDRPIGHLKKAERKKRREAILKKKTRR